MAETAHCNRSIDAIDVSSHDSICVPRCTISVSMYSMTHRCTTYVSIHESVMMSDRDLARALRTRKLRLQRQTSASA